MIIAGLQKTTLIDYPGKIACVVFLAVCNFRCPWCYSRELVLPLEIAKQPRISEKEFFDFLRQRQGLLEGVVLCGGEPTVNKELPQFIQKIKNLGFFGKLDTNGSSPEMLKNLVEQNLIDYVAMDIKLPKGKYPMVFSEKIDIKNIEDSVKFLKSCNIDYEFRSTILPKVHSIEDVVNMAKWIEGSKIYYLQQFRPEKTIDQEYENCKPFSNEQMEEIQKECNKYVLTKLR
ncbi:MAG: anaerobic ribonucleoside-triphosphate reductase activating protein [bacterium]